MGVNKVKGQKHRKGYRRLQKGALREVVGRMMEQSGRGNSGGKCDRVGGRTGEEGRAEQECGCPELPKMCVKLHMEACYFVSQLKIFK